MLASQTWIIYVAKCLINYTLTYAICKYFDVQIIFYTIGRSLILCATNLIVKRTTHIVAPLKLTIG